MMNLDDYKLLDKKGPVGLYVFEFKGTKIPDCYYIIDLKRNMLLFVGDKEPTIKVWRTFDPNNRESRTYEFSQQRPCLYRQGLTRNPLRIHGKK
jgi:hypothetical protein